MKWYCSKERMMAWETCRDPVLEVVYITSTRIPGARSSHGTHRNAKRTRKHCQVSIQFPETTLCHGRKGRLSGRQLSDTEIHCCVSAAIWLQVPHPNTEIDHIKPLLLSRHFVFLCFFQSNALPTELFQPHFVLFLEPQLLPKQLPQNWSSSKLLGLSVLTCETRKPRSFLRTSKHQTAQIWDCYSLMCLAVNKCWPQASITTTTKLTSVISFFYPHWKSPKEHYLIFTVDYC